MTEYAELSSLPFPVAYPLHFARDVDNEIPSNGRWDNAVFAVYQTMRLAALLMLADYLAVEHQEPALLARIRGLRAPHWQEWSLLADGLARYWTDPNRADKPRFHSVAAGWLSVSRVSSPGRKSPKLDAVWEPLIEGMPGLGGRGQARSANEAVWEIRNRGAHRSGTATPAGVAAKAEELSRLLPLAETIVQTVFGDCDFVLLRALPAGTGKQEVIELVGPHPDLHFAIQDADPDWAEALAETEVVAQFGEEVLPVYPFLLPMEASDDERPTGLLEPVAMIDGIAEGRLTVLGVSGGHTVKGLHLDATLAALKRKHGDLALDRREVAPWSVLAWARMTAQQTLEDIYNRNEPPRDSRRLFDLSYAAISVASCIA
jgi:hypothetical protein